MKVTIEDQSSVTKILHIEVPENIVTAELDSAYKEMGKTAKIKGFRTGKAPRSVLKRLYGKGINANVASQLIQDSLTEAVRENNLNMLGTPKIDPPELKSKEPYKFDVEIEVHPEISDIEFKGLNLKKTLYKPSDDEVDAQLKAIQKQSAKYEAITDDRGAEKDDFVLADISAFKDGKPYDQIKTLTNFNLKVGENRIVKDLDDGLIGMKPNEEKEIDVTFPVDYSNSELAGVNVAFRVKLNEIRFEILPEIDDELAKGLGSFESLNQLKEQIFDNLKEGYQKRVENELNEQAFIQLLDDKEFEVPETLIQHELNGIIQDAERSFSMHNTSLEAHGLTHEKLAEEYRSTAIKQVQRYLVLGKIIEQEKLSVSDTELEVGYNEMAKAYGQPIDAIKNIYKNEPKRIELFKHTLLEKKAMKLIIDNSNIEEVEPNNENRDEDTADKETDN